ncbi:unnamed protein product [Darwinula stevensoni]|uniref:Pikachurin n=1 Tax=Darwinula stevensoni TaxID=69355 RepID=A0A7R8X1B6_9CRUS|nr:unnamed protein product [Darwinula stevensoni]CAG0882633.1 unnamed protein product [Darwinula stevensoni]
MSLISCASPFLLLLLEAMEDGASTACAAANDLRGISLSLAVMLKIRKKSTCTQEKSLQEQFGAITVQHEEQSQMLQIIGRTPGGALRGNQDFLRQSEQTTLHPDGSEQTTLHPDRGEQTTLRSFHAVFRGALATRLRRLATGILGLNEVVVACIELVRSNSCVKKLHVDQTIRGLCDQKSPCEQECFNLHDGTYECDCREGYVLHVNGYSCTRSNLEARENENGVGIPEGIPPQNGINETELEDNFELEDDVKVNENAIVYEKEAEFTAHLSENLDPTALGSDRKEKGPQIPSQGQDKGVRSTTQVSALECRLDCAPGKCTWDEGRPRCLCPLGLHGDRCQTPLEVHVARFSGHSWLEYPVLRNAYETLSLTIEFLPEAWDGALLYSGEDPELDGDFFAVSIVEGFVEVRLDCGSGVGLIRSMEPVRLGRWNRLEIDRHRWDVSMRLNNGSKVVGRSKGLFSRITFREPMYVGGSPDVRKVSAAKEIGLGSGFLGCIRFIELNHRPFTFLTQPDGDARFGLDIEECFGDKCQELACLHGGKCVAPSTAPNLQGDVQCLCPLGYIGERCETPVDLEVPFFNGTSYLKYPALGSSALESLDLELTIKPSARDGLILFDGRRADADGTFLALFLRDGFLYFGFDHGDGAFFVRSEMQLETEKWHRVEASRAGRGAFLKIDDQPYLFGESPGGFSGLSLPQPLFLGGVPLHEGVPEVLPRQGFVGCVQKMVVNGKRIKILAASLSGYNVKNCEHPCTREPCTNGGTCLPENDRHSCLCPLGYGDPSCESQVSYQGANPMFFGNGYLFYGHQITHAATGSNTWLSLRFRTFADGLLLWLGDSQSLVASEFLSVSIEGGLLHLRYDLGSGEADIVANGSRVDDGHWHTVRVIRTQREGSLIVDDVSPIFTGASPGWHQKLDTQGGLHIGGVQHDGEAPMHRFKAGITGCIADLKISPDVTLHSIDDATSGVNVDLCV